MSSRHIRGSLVFKNYLEKTTAGNIAAADIANVSVILVNKTAGQITGITLREMQYVGEAIFIVDAKGDAATYNITVTPDSGTINGGGTYVISENYGSALLIWDGTNFTVAGRGAAASEVEMGYLDGVTAGTALASKAVVLDSNSNVTGVGRVGLSGLRFSDIGALNAAGNTIGNAAPIVSRISVVAGANDAKGVLLPVAVAGDQYSVYSSVATSGLSIYPQVNSTINDGTANAAIVIEGKTRADFIALSATNWSAIFTANS